MPVAKKKKKNQENLLYTRSRHALLRSSLSATTPSQSNPWIFFPTSDSRLICFPVVQSSLSTCSSGHFNSHWPPLLPGPNQIRPAGYLEVPGLDNTSTDSSQSPPNVLTARYSPPHNWYGQLKSSSNSRSRPTSIAGNHYQAILAIQVQFGHNRGTLLFPTLARALLAGRCSLPCSHQLLCEFKTKKHESSVLDHEFNKTHQREHTC